jgi:hypothetical protein
MPAERAPVARVLRFEVLRPVLADHLDAGFGEEGHVLQGHVLRRRDDGHARSDLGAEPFVPRPDLLRRCKQ